MIVITTPTGAIGHQLLEMLLDSSAPIRVIVRDPGKLSAAARSRVDIVEGSHGDADVVNRAFAGADALFWVKPPDFHAEDVHETYIGFTRPACEAIRVQGVKRVVSVSALGRGLDVAKNAGLVAASLEMDDLLMTSGTAFRALAMPSFMDNFLRQIVSIRDRGVFFGPNDSDLKTPYAAIRDIAAVAARLLLDPSWSGQGEVPVLGPENLSCNDLATIMTEVLGRPVRYQQVSFDDFAANLRKNGASEPMVAGMVDMMRAKNEGLDNGIVRTAETATPTSFRQFCREVLAPAVPAAAA